MKFFDSLFSGVKWTSISSVVISILALLKIAVMTRFLARSDFGQFALVASVLSFVQLFADFGISVALLHKKKIKVKDHASLYWLGLVTSLFIYTIYFFSIPLIATFFQEPILEELMPIAGLEIILIAIGNQYRILALKSLRYRQIALVNITGNLAAFTSAIYLAIMGWGVWALIISTLISTFLMQMLYFVQGNKYYRLKFHFSLSDIKPYWNIGKYSVGGEMINYFTREVDVILIGRLSDSATLGAYTLAKQLVQKPGRLINQVITDASLPILPLFQDDIPKLRKHFLEIVQTVSTIMAGLYGLFFLFSDQIVHIIYGDHYSFLTYTCRIFSLFFFLRMIIRFNANVIIATGNTHLSLLMNSITFPLTATAVFIGYQWGLAGIAWGQVGMMISLLFISWYFVLFRLLNLSVHTYLRSMIPNPFFVYVILQRIIKKFSK